MNAYNQEEVRTKINEIFNVNYERMYPFETEKELSPIFKIAEENSDEQIKQEILWEIDLINRAFGHKGTYQGKDVVEISNKWKHFLDTEEFKPFSNPPFCEWKKEALEYYKKRYNQTESTLAKARYAFAVMVFSFGQDRLEWMKKSVDNWLKTAEKYVADGVFNKGYYEVPPFAYKFALKLSLSFGQKELAKSILNSLHKNIIKIIESGEKRWHIEFFEVETKDIHQFDDIQDMISESVKRIKEIIEKLEQDFIKSTDKQKNNHFLRHHLKILISYKTEDEFDLNKRIAESYFSEAEWREEPLVKSAFYNDAIKRYKLMESKFSAKKEEIKKRIEELTLKIKEINSKIKYKVAQTSFIIKNEQIDTYIKELKKIDKDIFRAFLFDNSLFPKSSVVKSQTENQKKQYPLQFIIPVVIYNKEEPIMKHVLEEKIFDYQLRRNILLGIKIAELVIKMTFEKLEKELNIKTFEKADELLKIDELKDIYPTLQKGFYSILGETRDSIVGLHIIVPYFEEVIRRIIKKVGKVEVVLQSHKPKYFRGIELGTLLDDEEVGKLIDLDFQKSLKVLLVDNDQTNLRHELMHGRWKSEKIKEAEVLFLGYCLLKLIKILKDLK